MSNCLNCGKELHHVEGRRKKKFCSNSCRVTYWQKTHAKSQNKTYDADKLKEPINDEPKQYQEPKNEDLTDWRAMRDKYNQSLKNKNK